MGLYEKSDVMKVEQLSEQENKIRKSLIAFNQNVMMVLKGEKNEKEQKR